MLTQMQASRDRDVWLLASPLLPHRMSVPGRALANGVAGAYKFLAAADGIRETMGTKITFKRPDGKDASGYLAKPGRANAPGVVVIQEWWGLQEQIKGICDRFSLAGYEALAPDLYAGTVVPYHDTAA